MNENNILEFSNLELNEEFPDALTQEELLDKKKRERDKLGSVNLRADEETTKYQDEIKKNKLDNNKGKYNKTQTNTSKKKTYPGVSSGHVLRARPPGDTSR